MNERRAVRMRGAFEDAPRIFYTTAPEGANKDEVLAQEVTAIPSSEILLHMASVAHAGNLGPEHYFPQLTPFVALTWPESWAGETLEDTYRIQAEIAETQVMRLLLARAIALDEGD